jgi:glutamate-1-semialdehyde 2,1-aminomutase
MYAKFFRYMLKNGIFLPPSQFEACFISTAHSVEDIEKTIDVIRRWR